MDEWSTRRSDVYLTTLNNRQTVTYSEGLEPAIPASELSQNHALDRADSGIGLLSL